MARIVVIGCGAVGSTFAYTVLLRGLATELVIIDANREKALGDVLDLNHGLMLAHPMRIWLGDYSDCAGADLIVITAGAAQRQGETRLDLLGRNVAIFDSIIKQITAYTKDAILLVASNPVDILTQVALKLSGLPASRVIGSGTLLDSSRFRYLVAERLKIEPRSVHGLIIGEHGDSEVAVWSGLNAGGVPLNRPEAAERWRLTEADRQAIHEETRTAAYEIIARKGATYFAVALALARICEAILRDQHSVLPVSTYLEDYHGIQGVCLGVPAVVGGSGIEEVVPIPLDDLERKALQDSAETLKRSLQEIGFA